MINDTQKHVNDTLNNAIYGQSSSKRCIEQIIFEWITGNSKGDIVLDLMDPLVLVRHH